jgi:hypothetical protein
VQLPPSETQLEPPDWQMPPWQTPPLQQSLLVVQVPLPIAMQAAPQLKPVDELGSGVQILEQHSSPRLHGAPLL